MLETLEPLDFSLFLSVAGPAHGHLGDALLGTAGILGPQLQCRDQALLFLSAQPPLPSPPPPQRRAGGRSVSRCPRCPQPGWVPLALPAMALRVPPATALLQTLGLLLLSPSFPQEQTSTLSRRSGLLSSIG